jgi:hypothetical protein
VPGGQGRWAVILLSNRRTYRYLKSGTLLSVNISHDRVGEYNWQAMPAHKLPFQRKDAKLAKKPFNKNVKWLCVLCAFAVNNPGLD